MSDTNVLWRMVYNHLRSFISDRAPHQSYLVAYSGGLDSQVLLSALLTLQAEYAFQLRAIHIHHGLSNNASSWALHCDEYCKQHHIPFEWHAISIDSQSGESVEALARTARYKIFADALQPNEVLLTAHHEDDQAETFLLQLMRGAGLKGLSAMPAIKPFARGFHARPLLSFSRSDLETVAKTLSLRWCEDESNSNLQFSRNYLRHAVLPILKSRWPALSAMLNRTASHCAEAQSLLDDFTVSLLSDVRGSNQQVLSILKLTSQDRKKQRLILRAFIAEQGFGLPSTKKLDAILETVLTAGIDRQPVVSWGKVSLRRHRDDLHLVSESSHDPSAQYEWDISNDLVIPGVGVLSAAKMRERGFSKRIHHVTVKFRQGGEVAHVRGGIRHSLKTLFQMWGVPVWERTRVPLLFVGDQLVAAYLYFIDPNYTE